MLGWKPWKRQPRQKLGTKIKNQNKIKIIELRNDLIPFRVRRQLGIFY